MAIDRSRFQSLLPAPLAIVFGDIALVSGDGTVHPIYSDSPNFSVSLVFTNSGVTGATVGNRHLSNVGWAAFSTTEYYHEDHLGTSRLMTSYGGWPIWQGTFSSFGQEINAQVTTNRYRYAGYEYDAESGFDHAEFREYAGNLGRFAVPDPYSGSMDPSNPQSFNRYGYVLNNPMNSTDPSGLFPGAEGAAPLCGPAAPLCLAGAIIGDIFQLFHLFGHHHNLPVFHGSTNPRPPLQGETNGLPDGIRLHTPSWIALMGDSNCDFGGCDSVPGGLGFSGGGQSAVDIARCASGIGNSLSFASLLPQNAPIFLRNALSNDFSTISILVTGPGRVGAGASAAQGKLTSTAMAAIGQIPTGPSRLVLVGEGAAQNTLEVTPRLIDTIAGHTAGAVIKGAIDVKLAWDAATYLYGVAKCSNLVP